MPHERTAETDDGKPTTRSLVSRGFTWVEDVVYVGLGLLLSISAIVLLGGAAVTLVRDIAQLMAPAAIVDVLDRLLLVLMIVELLYTVQVSFREHALVPEPFLIVGLIAATRRVLVVTAEFPNLQDKGEAAFRVSMIELGVLTLMILVFVSSLLMLRRRHPQAVAARE